MNELGITYFARGDYIQAEKIFNENLSRVKNKYYKLTVNSLNNIGSTHFAQQNVEGAIEAFFEVLEVQRSQFIQIFSNQPSNNSSNLDDFKMALQAMSHTLHNLAYVYAYKEDSSTSSFFLETAVGINHTLNESNLSWRELLPPDSIGATVEV